MKIFYSLLLLFFTLFCFAQTDSTEIKLQKYKELHEKGLITQQEYELLKKKELNLLNVPESKDTVSLAALKKSYKSQLIAGSILFPIGITAIAGGIYSLNDVSIEKRTGVVLIATGAIITIAATIIIGKGISNKSKYHRQERILTHRF